MCIRDRCHCAYNTYYLVLRYMGIDYLNSSIQNRIHMTLCTEHGATCRIFGTTVFVALYSSSVLYARNIVRLFLDETRACGAQICYPYVLGTMTFGFSERRVLVPQAVGR